MEEVFYYIKVFGMIELESWSHVLYRRGYTYILEGEIFEGVTVYAIKVKVHDGASFEQLKKEFHCINDPKPVKY